PNHAAQHVAQAGESAAMSVSPVPSSVSGVGGGPPASAAVPVAAANALPKQCTTCGNRYPKDFVVCPIDATALDVNISEDADPLVGQIIAGTYRILRVVGEGGMGKVYEAQHLRLGHRKVAVKVLHPEYARDRDVVSRFQREAESASAITHSNVLEVYDVDTTADGRPFLVSEFLEGEELGDHLDRVGKVEINQSVRIVRQVCGALVAAHEKGIVHRDMKPENVFMIARDGMAHVKVIDFGISKSGTGETHLTRTGMIIGTPAYMAPEQARGDKVDVRADVYATGALLYTMLTGHRPFESDDPTATLTLVLTEEPRRPRELQEHIPEGLELIVQRAMAKNPADRYQTMIEFDGALAQFDVMTPPSAPTLEQHGDSMVISHHGITSDGSGGKARTIAARAGSAPAFLSAQRDAREAKLARPMIVALTATIALWFLVGFVDALGGAVRMFRTGDLTFTEAILLILGSGFLAVTPAVLFILHVRKAVWPNSVKAVELADDLRRTAAAALVGYGAAAILARAFDTVILRQSSALAAGGWDAGMFVVSFVAALVAGGVGPLARFSRRKKVS
ncbi:MAG: serine/threonine-protein kinase, partial [Polyangiaceae bacterium]